MFPGSAFSQTGNIKAVLVGRGGKGAPPCWLLGPDVADGMYRTGRYRERYTYLGYRRRSIQGGIYPPRYTGGVYPAPLTPRDIPSPVNTQGYTQEDTPREIHPGGMHPERYTQRGTPSHVTP